MAKIRFHCFYRPLRTDGPEKPELAFSHRKRDSDSLGVPKIFCGKFTTVFSSGKAGNGPIRLALVVESNRFVATFGLEVEPDHNVADQHDQWENRHACKGFLSATGTCLFNV